MKKFGLIGFPLEHSFSKSFFTEKFLEEDIEASYELFPLEDIRQIRELPARDPAIAGLNVTMPHKTGVIPFLDSLDPGAGKINAVNTITVERTGTKMFLKGYNTDASGFRRSFLEFIGAERGSCLILGTGGAARAVAFVLGTLDIPYSLVTRKESIPGKLHYDQLNRKAIEDHAFIINATPMGMVPAIGTLPDIPYEWLTEKHFLFDLVYNPTETLFLKKGREKGCRTRNGMDMLIYQAIDSWNIWNNV